MAVAAESDILVGSVQRVSEKTGVEDGIKKFVFNNMGGSNHFNLLDMPQKLFQISRSEMYSRHIVSAAKGAFDSVTKSY